MKFFLSLLLFKLGTETHFQEEMIRNNEFYTLYLKKTYKFFLVLFKILHKIVAIVLFENSNK